MNVSKNRRLKYADAKTKYIFQSNEQRAEFRLLSNIALYRMLKKDWPDLKSSFY